VGSYLFCSAADMGWCAGNLKTFCGEVHAPIFVHTSSGFKYFCPATWCQGTKQEPNLQNDRSKLIHCSTANILALPAACASISQASSVHFTICFCDALCGIQSHFSLFCILYKLDKELASVAADLALLSSYNQSKTNQEQQQVQLHDGI
jgi:hypothetical protein